MIEQLTKDQLVDIFPNTIYRRGLQYFRESRVKDLQYNSDTNIWTAIVRGSKTYHVRIEDSDFGISSECDCPAYEKYWSPCKHIAAVMIKIYYSIYGRSTGSVSSPNPSHSEKQNSLQDELEITRQALKRFQEKKQTNHVKQLTDQFIQTFSSFPKGRFDREDSFVNKDPLLIEWILKIHNPHFASNQFLTLEMKVGQKRTYVVKNLKEYLKAVKTQEQYPFTRNFIYDPKVQKFLDEDQDIIDLLWSVVKYEETYQQLQEYHYLRSSSLDTRYLCLPPIIIDEFLRLLKNRTFHFENGTTIFKEIKIFQSGEPFFSIQLNKRSSDEFQLDLTLLNSVKILELYGYIIIDNTFYKVSDEQRKLMNELKKLIELTKTSVLPVTKDQMESFVSYVLPQIEKISKLEIADDVSSEIIKFPLQAKLFIDRMDDVLQLNLEFHYGKNLIEPFEQEPAKKDGPILMRDTVKEQAILNRLEATSPTFRGKYLFIEGEEEIFEFLYERLPALEDEVDIFMTSAAKSLVVTDQFAPVTNIDVDSSGNWLEVSFDMSGITPEEVKNILHSVVEKKKYYRLPNGAFVSLQTDEFDTIQNMFEELKIRPSQLENGRIQLPIYRGVQLDELIAKKKAKYGKKFRRLLSHLKNPDELEFDIPDALQTELRDYQIYGFQWLKTLHYYGLGGVLADDMGLGKTIQSIAYILSEKNENKKWKPALIIAPASLVYNWKNEFQKFAPSVAVDVVIGTPQERMDKLQSNRNCDVWITSYQTLRQDIDSYAHHEFSVLILDEAQTIKNYATKTAKAVRNIKSQTRFALSGTPIENSIDELWAIFQAIMPDFFPNQKSFRQFETEKIAKMIRPFLLRRVKKDVLQELPDKIEIVNYSELTKQQKQLYLAYLEKIRNEAKESLQGEGFQKSRIKILAGLTRLRQLCCHPSLFLEDYKGDSGKLQELLDIIQNGLENNRRMLIFSQFTSMLSIIRDELAQAGLNFFYLDGQTAPKDRVRMVDQFNHGEADIFLISLKAGNTGLNLTGADTVILYDLWWNPAVEEQAAGRAHRIGQKNVVQVIRLITQGTIEEKIFELQQNKKELIETVVEPGNNAASSITEQEIREILNI